MSIGKRDAVYDRKKEEWRGYERKKKKDFGEAGVFLKDFCGLEFSWS